MKDQAINILIVDDHQMLLEGVRSFVAGQFPNASILLASSHKEILGILNKRSIDVLLLDLILGNEDSRTFLSQLLQIQPEMKIIVVSSMEEESIVNALLRSEEHTSELQSRPHLVCRLLLEKKKKKKQNKTKHIK